MKNLQIRICEPDGYSPTALQIYEQLGQVCTAPIPPGDWVTQLANANVLVIRLGFYFDRFAIQSLQRVKVIVSPTTGLDHIDLTAADDRGITVLSLKGEIEYLRNIPATAEHTWGLLLALVRRLPYAFENVRAGDWNRDAFRGRDLRGKTLGILGLGRIGEMVARFGLTFGMRVCAYDPYRADWMPEVTRYETPEALLAISQVLSIHLPLNESTRGFLTRARLSLLPVGAWLINTARGGLLDELALLELLQNGHLAGAALDVLDNETKPSFLLSNPLVVYARQADNLILTPHLGGATWDSMHNTEVFMAYKLEKWINSNQEKFAAYE